ncbi:C40 family peptidase [Virgibacillus necropolis]|uniref:Peptidase n=1 Tax=Virgibacillus necropolis TaxID=163877 RepID=A0A221M8Y5_9BACI|nr:C40 family peptidase [Virgibacillus necropolis]ASN04080.1 peptidase [Virgibacillus necropolis]
MTNLVFDKDSVWVVNVQVATVWTSKESARIIDEPGLSNPTDIEHWVTKLTQEQKTALCGENRVQSQLLYGEVVEVTEIDGGWAHIVIPSQPSHKDSRGYPGLVPIAQLQKIGKTYWNQPKSAAIVSKKAWLEADQGENFLKLSYMTCLPVLNEHPKKIEVATPHGTKFLPNETVHIYDTHQGLEKKNGDEIVKSGEQFLSLAYFWGGMSSFGYDCSGFSYATHKACGYQIPRDASDQAEAGEPVEIENLFPGDLLFFAYEEGKGTLHHVGVYYGEGKMIHSRTNGKLIEIIELKGTIYEEELCAARRYWNDENAG